MHTQVKHIFRPFIRQTGTLTVATENITTPLNVDVEGRGVHILWIASIQPDAQILVLREESSPVPHLFFGTVAADHPGGQLHGVILILIVTHVTWVDSTTAREPESHHRWGGRKEHSKHDMEIPLQSRLEDISMLLFFCTYSCLLKWSTTVECTTVLEMI